MSVIYTLHKYPIYRQGFPNDMADKGFRNAEHLQVKVFGEKEGRYDLEKLPKLIHSKKYKPDKRKTQIN